MRALEFDYQHDMSVIQEWKKLLSFPVYARIIFHPATLVIYLSTCSIMFLKELDTTLISMSYLIIVSLTALRFTVVYWLKVRKLLVKAFDDNENARLLVKGENKNIIYFYHQGLAFYLQGRKIYYSFGVGFHRLPFIRMKSEKVKEIDEYIFAMLLKMPIQNYFSFFYNGELHGEV